MLPDPPVADKLDPRVKRTRGLIQQAFMALLAEKGFSAITVQDITERAEINRATFYAHFSDKYALFEYAMREAFRQELEKRTLNACHYSEENLRALIVALCEFVAHLRQQCKASERQFESLAEAQIKKQVQELIELWLVQTGATRDPRTAATAASWAIYGLAAQWSTAKDRPAVQAYAAQVLPLALANLKAAQPA